MFYEECQNIYHLKNFHVGLILSSKPKLKKKKDSKKLEMKSYIIEPDRHFIVFIGNLAGNPYFVKYLEYVVTAAYIDSSFL